MKLLCSCTPRVVSNLTPSASFPLYPGNKGMLATLLALYFYFPDLARMHIYVLGFLVAGLMVSVNW